MIFSEVTTGSADNVGEEVGAGVITISGVAASIQFVRSVGKLA